MRCVECGREFGEFDHLIHIYHPRISSGVELVGLAHAWHYRNQEDES